MSYQGILLAMTVTVAIGAAIYNYFKANTQKHSYCDGPDYNYTFSPRTATNPKPPKRNRKKDEDECTICLTAVVSNGKKLSCGHIFHVNCINKWFNKQNSCPNCRTTNF